MSTTRIGFALLHGGPRDGDIVDKVKIDAPALFHHTSNVVTTGPLQLPDGQFNEAYITNEFFFVERHCVVHKYVITPEVVQCDGKECRVYNFVETVELENPFPSLNDLLA